MKFSLLSVVLFGAVQATALPTDGAIYFNEAQAHDAIVNFLDLSAVSSHYYEGKNAEGFNCEVQFIKDNNGLAFQSFQSLGSSFNVAKTGSKVSGGMEGNKLWASYFINKPSTGGFTIPGQYGTSYELKLQRGGSHELVEWRLRVVEQMDLAYRVIGDWVCRF